MPQLAIDSVNQDSGPPISHYTRQKHHRCRILVGKYAKQNWKQPEDNRHRPADLAASSPKIPSAAGSAAGPGRADFLNLPPPNNPGTSPPRPGPRRCNRLSSSSSPAPLPSVPELALDFPLQSSSSNAPHSSPGLRPPHQIGKAVEFHCQIGELLSAVGGGGGNSCGDGVKEQGTKSHAPSWCRASCISTIASSQPLLGATTSRPR